MKGLQAVALFVGGAIGESVSGPMFSKGMHALIHTPVVHAQDQFTTFAGCISVVPKVGEFCWCVNLWADISG